MPSLRADLKGPPLRTLPGILGAVLLASMPAVAQRAPAVAPAGLPPEVLSLACAPTLTFVEPFPAIRVSGGQDSFVRRGFAPGDLVTITAGTRNNVTVGQRFFVRRPQVSRSEPITPQTPAIIRTAGWVEVYAVDETMSLATVAHACDAIEVGDYLEPFVLPAVPLPAAERPAPQRENYGRVMMGQDRRRSFGRGDYLTVNRGSDHGVMPGTHFVLYRDNRVAENFLFEIGEAVAMDVKPDSATLRVTLSLDAIQEGDYVAMRR
jgi:hypothetical protein